MVKNNLANLKNIEESQIPALIQQQFTQLKNLRENVDIAVSKAEDASLSAKEAKSKSAGLFHKKEAIESLQNATVNLADAQISQAEAQKVSFEYQQKLGEITKYLFGLGVMNIAANRSVVRNLEMRLKGASQEELDELARREIVNVVKQLKAQEDIMKKQSDLSKHVKEHERRLERYENKDLEYDKRFKEHDKHEKTQNEILKQHAEKNKEYEILLENSKKKDAEHDRLLAEKAKKDKSQDEEIMRQAAKDEELGQRIDKGEEKDKIQDEEIMRQAAKDEELGQRIDEREEKDKSQDEEIERQAVKDAEHDKLIKELMNSNLENTNQIIELKKICTEFNTRIEDESKNIYEIGESLNSKIDSKAGKDTNIISIIIAFAALVISVAQFFI